MLFSSKSNITHTIENVNTTNITQTFYQRKIYLASREVIIKPSSDSLLGLSTNMDLNTFMFFCKILQICK